MGLAWFGLLVRVDAPAERDDLCVGLRGGHVAVPGLPHRVHEERVEGADAEAGDLQALDDVEVEACDPHQSERVLSIDIEAACETRVAAVSGRTVRGDTGGNAYTAGRPMSSITMSSGLIPMEIPSQRVCSRTSSSHPVSVTWKYSSMSIVAKERVSEAKGESARASGYGLGSTHSRKPPRHS